MSPEKLLSTANAGYYPVPLASHDDIVKDQTLFINTLRSFHFTMGSKFLIPVIGGKELNLHVLYVEVTQRGGYDKVVTEKKWREISSVFDFSPKTTSASYALRKHYSALLHRYELVYFARTGDSPTTERICAGGLGYYPVWKKIPGPSTGADLACTINFEVLSTPVFRATGTIDGKFDCGYLVSVRLGDETLNGVLYHPGSPSSSDTGNLPQFHLPGRRTRRKRGGDPGRPKPNRSGYNFFFAEKHAMLKSLYPVREREFTKMIGESWSKLSPEEREVYQRYGLKDKERYLNEMKEYKERVKMGQHSV